VNHIGVFDIDRTAVKVGEDLRNIRLFARSRSAGRLFYGPTAETVMAFGWLEPGETVVDYAQWPELWVCTAYSTAIVDVWEGVGLSFKTPSPKIGTSFKGGPPIELASDGTVSQLSTTVIGTHALTLAQDPRNHPSAVVWVSTHVDLLPEQKTPQGKPLPESGPPGGTAKQFPLLHGQYLQLPGFNSAVWAWAEPDQKNVGPIRVYFVKHEFGV